MDDDISKHIDKDLPELDLRQLRSFVVVARKLHFGRAAALLGIAQPPLSQQIQRLENRVGYLLFTRKGRGIQLTPAGKALLAVAKRAQSDIAVGLEEVRRIGRGEAGHLRIGFAGSVALTILPSVVQMFRARYPAVTIDLIEKTTTPQIEALCSGILDVGFLREAPPEGTDLAHVCVYREPLVALLPCDHALAQKASVAPLALADELFILFYPETGPAFYSRIIDVCHAAGFTPRIGQHTGEWLTIAGLVAAGAGVSIAPECVGQIRLPGLVAVSLDTTFSVGIVLARHPDNDSPLVGNFLDVALEIGSVIQQKPDSSPVIS